MENNAERGDMLVKIRATQHIIDYFFPKDFRQRNNPPPYFRRTRRTWFAPYDCYEVGLSIEWLRRHVKLKMDHGTSGLFVLVVPGIHAAQACLSAELRPQLMLAARQNPGLDITIIHPKDQAHLFQPLAESLNDPSETFGRRAF